MRKRIIIGVLFLSIFILSCFTVNTYSYFTSGNEIVNKVEFKDNESKVVEEYETPVNNPEPGSTIKKIVQVTNLKGDSFIRMRVLVSDSSLLSKISLDYNTTDWKKESDGFWYYKYPLKMNETTKPIITKVDINSYIPDDKELEIICYSESVRKGSHLNYLEAFKEIEDFEEDIVPVNV